MANSTEHGTIPMDILDDLSSRFIINIPEEERKNPIRLFFQIEQAHWFYIDFYRAEDSTLKSYGMKEFSKRILNHIPTFKHLLLNFDEYYDKWKDYKMSVPTFGAIVLNEDMTKVLLVQSYFEKTSWGFPKGKVNEDEDFVKCATREVYEETGFDISNLIHEDEYIEAVVCEQTIRLYVIRGVKETEKFHPKTRNEIKNVEWFNINDLPINKKDVTPKIKMGVRPNSFFMVLPFVKRIKNWIQEKRAEDLKMPVNRRRTRHKSVGEISLSSPSPSNVLPKNKRLPITNSAALMEAEFEKLRKTSPGQAQTFHAKSGKQVKVETKIFRRSLFSGDGITYAGNSTPSTKQVVSSKDESPIIVPRWLNFKLDKEPLLRCFNI